MTKIVDTAPISKNLHTDLDNFYRMFDMGHILHRVGADKEQGVSCKQILFARKLYNYTANVGLLRHFSRHASRI